MDLFKLFKTLQAEMPVAYKTSRNLFAAIFVPMRNLYWPYVCSEFWLGDAPEPRRGMFARHVPQR